MHIATTRNHKARKLSFSIALVIALGFIGYSLYSFWLQYSATHQLPKEVQPDSIITYSTDIPDETPPLCREDNFPASQPRYINIPTIGAGGCIQKVGIDQHSAMAVPSNIHLSGWYVKSVAPGQTGLSVIDGHSGGKYLDGIFKHLAELKLDDKFTIEFGDKSKKTFQVVSVNHYSVDETSKRMLEKNSDIKKQLNLITCGTNYSSDIQGYKDRVLVVAKSVE